MLDLVKFQILVLSMVLISAQILSAQNRPVNSISAKDTADRNIVQLTVKYNVITGELKIPKPVKSSWFFPAKKSTYVNFQILNFNPFYNKAELKADQGKIITAMPEIFTTIVGNKSNVAVDVGGKSSNTDKTSDIKLIDNFRDERSSFKTKISDYLSQINSYQKFTGLQSYLQKKVNSPITTNAVVFKNQIKVSTESYLGVTLATNSEKDLFDKSNTIYQSLISDFSALKEAYNKAYVPLSNNVLKAVLDKSKKKLVVTIDTVSTQENVYQEAYNYVNQFYNKLLIDSVSKSYKTQIENGVLLYQKIQNEPFVLIKEPQLIDDESDYVDFSLKLENNDDKTSRTIAPIRIYQSGGLKIDFSTGIAFGLGGARDRSYSLQQPDTSSITIKQNNNYNDFFPSVAAFLHIYGRDYYHSILPALTLGISTNPAGLEQTSFYAGSSLMFRNSLLKRIILSSGLAAANVDYLKNTYQTDYTYTKSNFRNYTNLKALTDDDLVERKFRFGWFVSVSYNLSKTK